MEICVSCTKVTCRHAVDQICSLWLYSAYTVVAGIFVPSAASCRTIHGVKSVRSRDYSQPLAILPTVTHPSCANLIFIRVQAGEGNRILHTL